MPSPEASRRNGAKNTTGMKPGTKWKSTLAKEAAAELYRQEVMAQMAGIVSAQIRAALGDGERPPDTAMSRYLTDQVIGKPIEKREITGPNGGPIATTVVHEYHAD